MGGNVDANHNLGAHDCRGDFYSLKTIKDLYSKGYATKDDYAKALRSYQAYLNEVRSDQRDEAAVSKRGWIYFESENRMTLDR